MREKVVLNKIKRLAAAIGVVAVILVIIAYTRGMTNLGIFATGMILSAVLIEAVANPIEEEEEV
jgi:energy-converting hydrogenase Eha subunit E